MSDTVSCQNCGAKVPVAHRFCGTCGQKMSPPDDAPVQYASDDGGHRSAGMRAHLVRIHGGGTDGEVYVLENDAQTIGRTKGHIAFPDDPFVSPVHATLYFEGEQLFIRDENSQNGVFFRMNGEAVLENGDTFMAGEELLRVEFGDPGGLVLDGENTHFFGSPRPTNQRFFRVRQILEGGEDGLCHYAVGLPITIGREGTVLEFPNDRFISGRHCSLDLVNGETVLADLNSRNGTFLRLKEPRPLNHRDFVFIGRQLLRIDIFPGSSVGGAL
ncbi:MAG: FHA domain-containing protein [Myxococcota bacterium]|nr:FHA domain-containing protein [Myxococcota bacterium]